MEAANTFVERLTDAAGADNAERGGGAHIGLQPVERERTPQRQHQRDHAECHFLILHSAGRANTSTERGSIASMTSENSLAMMPVL